MCQFEVSQRCVNSKCYLVSFLLRIEDAADSGAGWCDVDDEEEKEAEGGEGGGGGALFQLHTRMMYKCFLLMCMCSVRACMHGRLEHSERLRVWLV